MTLVYTLYAATVCIALGFILQAWHKDNQVERPLDVFLALSLALIWPVVFLVAYGWIIAKKNA